MTNLKPKYDSKGKMGFDKIFKPNHDRKVLAGLRKKSRVSSLCSERSRLSVFTVPEKCATPAMPSKS